MWQCGGANRSDFRRYRIHCPPQGRAVILGTCLLSQKEEVKVGKGESKSQLALFLQC